MRFYAQQHRSTAGVDVHARSLHLCVLDHQGQVVFDRNLQILNAQYNLAPFPKKLSFAANRAEMDVAGRFSDPSVQKSAAINLALIDQLDVHIVELELYLTRTAKVDDLQTFNRLRSMWDRHCEPCSEAALASSWLRTGPLYEA